MENIDGDQCFVYQRQDLINAGAERCAGIYLTITVVLQHHVLSSLCCHTALQQCRDLCFVETDAEYEGSPVSARSQASGNLSEIISSVHTLLRDRWMQRHARQSVCFSSYMICLQTTVPESRRIGSDSRQEHSGQKSICLWHHACYELGRELADLAIIAERIVDLARRTAGVLAVPRSTHQGSKRVSSCA